MKQKNKIMRHVLTGTLIFLSITVTRGQWTGQTGTSDLANSIYRTGYVGIGTTSTPQALLHLNSPSDARQTFRIYNSTNYLNIWQGTSGAVVDPIGTGLLFLGYDKTTNVIMNGNVGIGIAAPN